MGVQNLFNPNINPFISRKRATVVGHATLNEPTFEVEEIQPVGGDRDETTTTYIKICASDRRAIRTAEEIGGVCRVCEQFVCVKCADHECELCGSVVCRHESVRTVKGDVWRNH